jgi:hypothetical protein
MKQIIVLYKNKKNLTDTLNALAEWPDLTPSELQIHIFHGS